MISAFLCARPQLQTDIVTPSTVHSRPSLGRALGRVLDHELYHLLANAKITLRKVFLEQWNRCRN
jgi:hypothetical protein